MKNLDIVIRVDGDACPSRNLIEKLAKKYKIKMLVYVDYAHEINSDYAKVKVLDKSSQSVDLKIIADTLENDIVITQDYGLASLVLLKKAYAIGTKGLIYTNDNIDKLLNDRYINNKIRKITGKSKGPKKRTLKDDENLVTNLEKLIVSITKKTCNY